MSDDTPLAADTASDPWAYDAKTPPARVPLALLPVFVDLLRDPQRRADHVFHGALMVRKLLATDDVPPIQAVIDAGAVPLLMLCLRGPSVELQFEACWALSNVTSGTTAQMQVVIWAGFIPELVPLLDSPSEDVREQAAWAVGNIAGDGTEARDLFLRAGVMPPLLRCAASESPKITVMRNALWALSNMIRVKPLPDWATVVVPTLPLIASRLHHRDSELAADACWALSYLSDEPTNVEQMEAVLNIEGLLPRVVQLLATGSPAQVPALRTVGNIVLSSDPKSLLEVGLLQYLSPLLEGSASSGIRKAALWALSNIAVGCSQHIQKILDAHLLPIVIAQALPEGGGEDTVRKEAVWTLVNMVASGTEAQRLTLAYCGALSALCSGLSLVPRAHAAFEVLLRELVEDGCADNGEICASEIMSLLGAAGVGALRSQAAAGLIEPSGLTMAILLAH